MTLPTHLLWLDLETTGLDPYTDGILEVAAGLTPLAKPFATKDIAWFERTIGLRDWSLVSEAVIAMHVKSGLIGDCVESKVELDAVEKQLISMLPDDALPRSILLAGSTVHFDLGFIRRWMPKLDVFLHHRVYDVSSLRNVAYSLGMPEDPHEEAPHRAKADILRSLVMGERVLGWLREKFGDERELELRRAITLVDPGVGV